MKLGVNIPNFGPDTSPSSLAGWVQFAEDTGFDLAMMSDHVAPTPDVAGVYPVPLYEPFSTLAWLAGRTERLELGTTVAILPLRHPILTARMAAQIDQFSGGRLVLGVGVGWSASEYAALGPSFQRRGSITDDYLAAIKTLWTNDVASYQGTFASFTDVHTLPHPSRVPHPPIWIGGSSAPALRRAVTFGDGWHPIGLRPGWLRKEGLTALRTTAERAERPVPALCPRMNLRLRTSELSDTSRLSGEGTLEQALRDLDDLADLGASYVVLDTNPDHPSQRLSATDEWRMLETIRNAWPPSD